MSTTRLTDAARDAYNATVDLLERNARDGPRRRTYLRTEDRDLSYQEVAAAADAAGSGLLELGLEAGRSRDPGDSATDPSSCSRSGAR